MRRAPVLLVALALALAAPDAAGADDAFWDLLRAGGQVVEGELLVLTPLADGDFRVAGRMKP